MEIKQLQYLNTLYETKSYTKAAEKHFISQPNITTAVKKLEEELNCQLINRQSRPLRFTEEGEFFITYVKNILYSINEGKIALESFIKKRNTTIHISIAASIGNGLLPLLYTEFLSSNSGVDLRCMDASMAMILDFISNDTLDLAYTMIPNHKDLRKYNITLVQNSELCLLINKDHPLASEDRISFSMLKDERILTFPEGSLILDRLQHYSKIENVSLNYQIFTQVYVMEELVKQNYGIATITVNAFNRNDTYDKYVVKPFETPILFEEGFIVKKGKILSIHHELLMKYITDKADELNS